MTTAQTLAFLPLIFALTACALTKAGDQFIQATMTPTRIVQTTPVPTIDRQTRTIPTAIPEPTNTPGMFECELSPDKTQVQHTVLADLDFPNYLMMVQQQIDYINNTQNALSQLVLNIRPAIRGDIFQLQSLQLASNEADLHYQQAGIRWTVDLPKSLQPSCQISLKLLFKLTIPPIDTNRQQAYQGYLGYSERQLNLGQWLPVVAARIDDTWISHEEIPIGEQETLDEANWDVTLHVKGASDTLRVAGPGTVVGNGPSTWHYTLNNARDFSLSMSEHFRLTTQEAKSGANVELYSFDDAQIQTESGVMDTAAFALDSATKSLSTYEDLFGPYPHDRLVIVEGDFPDGMEFSGIVFVGDEYFRSFNGPTSYLMIITVHEVSHQWWYSQVGNDQALYPWLDEALATYSEFVFIEEYYPALKNWWWDFRVNSLSPEGFVDSTVYDFTSRRAYINAIYLRGVRMLDNLRDNLGTERFFQWLRRYADTGTGKIMTPQQLWLLLTPEELQLTEHTRELYLQHPQIIVIATNTPSS